MILLDSYDKIPVYILYIIIIIIILLLLLYIIWPNNECMYIPQYVILVVADLVDPTSIAIGNEQTPSRYCLECNSHMTGH